MPLTVKRAALSLLLLAIAVTVSLALSTSQADSQSTPSAPAAAEKPAATDLRSMIARTRRTLALLENSQVVFTVPAEGGAVQNMRPLLDALQASCPVQVVVAPGTELVYDVNPVPGEGKPISAAQALAMITACGSNITWRAEADRLIIGTSRNDTDAPRIAKRVTASYDVMDIVTLLVQRDVAVYKLQAQVMPTGMEDQGDIIRRAAARVTQAIGNTDDDSVLVPAGGDGLLVIHATYQDHARVEDVLADMRQALGITPGK